ncbi:MAG TPA: hypothetical protein VMM58_14250 [Bacteroidota bacterium]|nr:hypothetical protein [Bacteroidota bacterium]
MKNTAAIPDATRERIDLVVLVQNSPSPQTMDDSNSFWLVVYLRYVPTAQRYAEGRLSLFRDLIVHECSQTTLVPSFSSVATMGFHSATCCEKRPMKKP